MFLLQSSINAIPIGVTISDTVAEVAIVLGLAIAAGLGLAVTVYAVIVGWRKIKVLTGIGWRDYEDQESRDLDSLYESGASDEDIQRYHDEK